MDEWHKHNHNSYALYYHIVFVTAKRQPLIDQDVAAFLREFLCAQADEQGARVLALGVLCDHVHLVLSCRPTHYLPELLQNLKGISAYEANHYREFESVLYWRRGYHVDTISKRALPQVCAYVRDQLTHHPDKHPPAPINAGKRVPDAPE